MLSAAVQSTRRLNIRPRCGLARNMRPPQPTLLIFTEGSGGRPTARVCCGPRLLLLRKMRGLRHALGLTLVRLKRPDDALAELHRAAELDPGQARYAWHQLPGTASGPSGRIAEAIDSTMKIWRILDDAMLLLALVSFCRDSEDARAALEYAERLAGIAPQDFW